MLLHMHNSLQKPVIVKATRVLITFQDGTPFALLTEGVPGHAQIYRAGDPDFNERLRMAGVEHTVFIDQLQPATVEGKPSRLIH